MVGLRVSQPARVGVVIDLTNAEVVDNFGYHPEHFHKMAVIRLVAMPGHGDMTSGWRCHLKRQPFQVGFLSRIADYLLTVVNSFRVQQQHKLLAVEPPLSIRIADASNLFSSGTTSKFEGQNLTVGMVKSIVHRKIKGFWTEELQGIFVGFDSRCLGLVAGVYSSPVFISARVHHDWEDKVIIGSSFNHILKCPLAVVIKSGIILARYVLLGGTYTNRKFEAMGLLKRYVFEVVWV